MRESSLFNKFIEFEPVKRFENRADMIAFGGFDNTTNKRDVGRYSKVGYTSQVSSEL